MILSFKNKVNIIYLVLLYLISDLSFPGDAVVQTPPASAGDTGLIPGLGRSPGGGNDNPFHGLPRKSHEHRRPVGYGPQGSKEPDTAE